MDTVVISAKPRRESFLRLGHILLWQRFYIFLAPIALFLVIPSLPRNGLEVLMRLALGLTTSALALFLVLRINHKTYHSSKYFIDSGNLTYTLSKEGVLIKATALSDITAWHEIARVYNTNESFFIMKANHTAIIIDKEDMTREQVLEVESMVRGNLATTKIREKVKGKIRTIHRTELIPHEKTIIMPEVCTTPLSPQFAVSVQVHLTKELFEHFVSEEFKRRQQSFLSVALRWWMVILAPVLLYLGLYKYLLYFLAIPAINYLEKALMKSKFKEEQRSSYGFGEESIFHKYDKGESTLPWHQVDRKSTRLNSSHH